MRFLQITWCLLVFGSLVVTGCSDDDEGTLCPEAYAVWAGEEEAELLVLSTLPEGQILRRTGLLSLTSDHSFSAVAISPRSTWAVLATFDSSAIDARDWQATLHIYNVRADSLHESLDKDELRGFLNFPNPDAAMQILALGWSSDSTLIAHVKPRIDFLPIGASNISWRFDIAQKQTLETAPSASGNDFAIAFPEWQQKMRYPFEIVDGQVFIDGRVLSGSAQTVHFDLSYL